MLNRPSEINDSPQEIFRTQRRQYGEAMEKIAELLEKMGEAVHAGLVCKDSDLYELAAAVRGMKKVYGLELNVDGSFRVDPIRRMKVPA